MRKGWPFSDSLRRMQCCWMPDETALRAAYIGSFTMEFDVIY